MRLQGFAGSAEVALSLKAQAVEVKDDGSLNRRAPGGHLVSPLQGASDHRRYSCNLSRCKQHLF